MPADSIEDPVEKLLFDALEAIDRDGDRGLEALCRDHPERAEALRRRLEALRDAGLAPGRDDDSFPERLGEFHLIDRLGQGGMGVVYRARQDSLGREVALKLVRPDLLYFPGARERFRREVETIGALQHPGIVPIHLVGEEDGIPFYAMELVRGVTLADVVDHVSERAPQDLTGVDFVRAIDPSVVSASEEASTAISPLFQGSWTEVVLRVVREVAESLEHAHRRGVVHRDVKPSNIMVTAGGRVLLLDFGLASTAGVDRMTRTGSQLGTLPYMSPEQLDGADVDGRTDVYSLGAVLFELLALRAPFAANTIGELLTAIRTGVAPRVRSANPAVSWETEAVVQTALAPEHERRYSSAARFAYDLDNVLENRPIEARRSGPVRRFWRWSQRHPSAAIAIVLAVLAVLAGPAGWAVNAELTKRELAAAYRKESDALERERAALASSEANYETALDAIGYVLRTMAADDLRSSPALQITRRQAIERALSVFADLELRRPDDERLVYERARLVASHGQVLGELGDRPAGIAALEQAIAGLTRIVERDGEFASSARYARAQASHTLASYLQASGHSDRSHAAIEAAISDLRDPAVGERHAVGLDLVAALDLRAAQVHRRGELQRAEELQREALGIASGLVDSEPSNAGFVYRKGRAHGSLAITLGAQQRYEEALEHASSAVELARSASESTPGDRVYRGGLAHYLCTRGSLLCEVDRPAEGLLLLERGLVLREELVRDFPMVEANTSDLISTRTQVATARAALGRGDEVHELFEANLRDAERLATARPENPMLRYDVAAQRHNLATLLAGEGREWERFQELEQAALQEARELLALDPTNGSYRVLQHRTAHGVAIAACELQAPDEARAALEEFLALGELDLNGVVLTADAWARLWMCLDRHDMASAERANRQDRARAAMYDQLERAVAIGFRQPSALRGMVAFEPFVHEAEFQALFERLELR